KVEFYVNGSLVNTDTAAPWSFNVSGLANGSYTLTAKAFDQLGATTSSAPIPITVGPQPNLHFVHVDHLNTPRAIYDDQQRLEWKWEQQEPFGVNVPDENPSALGTFEFPVRFPGQYADKETSLFQNVRRDLDSGLGRFIEFDPLGVLAYRQPERRLNQPYAYVEDDPIRRIDPLGLCPCKGGHWSQGSNFGFGLMLGGGAQFSIGAIFTCKSDPTLQCRGNVICIGGGLMASGGLGADVFGDVYGAYDSGDLNDWSSGLAGSFGPISATGFFSGGGTVSVMKAFGGGLAYVSCRAYYVKCICPCSK